jgi:hypothetical protein
MEQRKKSRKSVRFSFRYLSAGAEAEEKARDGTVVDLNDQGIRFETEEKLPVGTKLQLDDLDKKLKEGGSTSGREGVVVWSIQPDPGVMLFRVGLKYL